MKKTELYTEGARLPEQLSRLIFLEGMIAGRRVLEVGARSSAVARFLLEQGASRVVCAVDDRDLLEQLRDANDIDKIDYRAVRPAGGSRPPGLAQAPVLPGDDGAFDLVIDFTLPEALAAGVTERLSDIKRLLSADGFAITALPSSPRGLGMLLDAPSSTTPNRLAYRPLADALRGSFELAQVYFQSLMLGYLFGSFDIESGDDGIAPQTALMGDDAEPAGAYLFAFGNAIPVIEDVCLVQVPFDTLLDAVLARRDTHEHPVVDASALRERDARIVALEQQLQTSKTRGDDDDVGAVVAGLARRLDEAVARALTSEQQVGVREIELVRALGIRDELRLERDALAEQLVAVDGERGELSRRGRVIEEELVLTGLRVLELEDAAIAGDAQRSALQLELVELHTIREAERQRHHAEREMLEAAILEGNAFANELQAALRDAVGFVGIAVEPTRSARSDDDTDTVAARVRASLQERFAVAEERALRAEALANALAEQLAIAERDLDDARLLIDERAAAVEAVAAEEAARSQATSMGLQLALDDAGRALDDATAALARRTDEATRLAAAVSALIAERARWREHHDARAADDVNGLRAALDEATGRLAATTTRADSSGAEATELRLALDEVRAAFDAANGAAKQEQQRLVDQHAEVKAQLEHRRSHDQRQLEEARRQLDDARGTAFELTAQRDVLQQALGGRERELAAVVADIEAARTTIEQLTGELAAQKRQHGDVERAAEALSLEVRRLNAVVDDNGVRLLALQQEREALQQRVDAADAARAAAEDETLKMMVLVEEVEAAGATAREQWRLEHEASHAAALAAVDVTLQATQQALRDAEAALARTLEAARTAADDAARASNDLDAERRSHEATRDELAQLTAAVLELEATVARQRADADIAHAAAVDAAKQQFDEVLARERAGWQDEQQALQGMLEEASTTQDALRAELSTTRSENDAARAEHVAAIAAAQQQHEDAVVAAQQAHDDAVVAAQRQHDDALAAERARWLDEQQALQALLDETSTTQETLRDELTAARTARDDVDEALTQLRAAHEQQLGERAVIEATLAEATTVLVERTATLETLQARHSALGLEHAARAEEASTLASTLASLRDEHSAATATWQAALSAQQAEHGTQAKTLSTTLTALQAKLDQQTTATRAAENEWLRADEALATTTTQLTTTTAALDALRAEHAAIGAAHSATQQQLADAQSRIDVLQQRYDTTMAQLEEVDDEAQLAAERAYHKAVEQDRAIADLRAALDDASAAHAQTIDAIRQEHADALGLAELARDELTATLELRSTREAELEAQITAARLEAEVAGRDVARLVDELAAAQDAATTAQTGLEAQQAQLRADLEAVRADLDAARTAEAALRQQHDDDSTVHAEAIARLQQQHETALVAARTALAAAESHANDTLALVADEHGMALGTLRAELAEVLARAVELGRALEAARAEGRDALERQAEAHDNALQALQQALAAAEASGADVVADLTARLAAAEGQLAESTAAAAATIATHARDLDEARKTSGASTSRVGELERALDDAIQQYADEAEQKEALEAELKSARARVAELDQLREQQQRADAETLALLTSSRDAAIAARATTDDALDSARERYEALQERYDAAVTEHADVDAARLAVVAALSAVEAEQQGLRDKLAAFAAIEADAARLAADNAVVVGQLAEQSQRAERIATELEESVGAGARERARGDLLQATLDEARAIADAVRAELSALRVEHDDERHELRETTAQLSADADEERLRAERLQHELTAITRALHEARDVDTAREQALRELEAEHARALEAERARVADSVGKDVDAAVRAALDDAAARAAADADTAIAAAVEIERARSAVLEATLDETRAVADSASTRAALLAATLQEARDHEGNARARADLLAATLEEARDHADRERARADLLTATLQEVREYADDERSRLQRHASEHMESITASITAEVTAEVTEVVTARLAAQHAAELEARLEDAQAVAAMALRRNSAEATAAQTEIATLRAELEAAALPAASVDEDAVARLRTELGELMALNESRAVELEGLRDALITAREDGRDLEELLNAHEARAEALAMSLAQQEQAVAAAQQAHRDLLDDTEVANAQRDAALAEIEMAEASARDEQHRRTALEDELAQVRLELERTLAHPPAAREQAVDGAELALLREKLEAADRQMRLRDEKIAEQAERINRLTERIVRNER